MKLLDHLRKFYELKEGKGLFLDIENHAGRSILWLYTLSVREKELSNSGRGKQNKNENLALTRLA